MKRNHARRLAGLVAALALGAALPVFAEAEAAAGRSHFSLGAGLGIPFGVIGVSCEMNPILGGGDAIADHVSFNLGLGYAGAGPGFSLGLRVYPLGRERTWAPKLSLLYGVVAVVNWEDVVRGFAAGAGVVRRLRGRLALDGDLIFILNRFGFDWIDWRRIGRFKASLGLRWNLDGGGSQ